ncbi:hypothetical protein D210916BOD24_11860 [Alteromonas sp. D210916BOD_24]|uniref:CC0125/CC1285 family lipoprotein n=1 Tax=Alteromonas sp. D210916BOD_24 TaxID=3157618 RepID=UPI00399C5D04
MSVTIKPHNKSALFACIAIALGLTLSGCSSTPVAAPTPYKSATSKAGYGYSSEKVQENEYKVLFKATDKTPADKVQQYALYRAAEIAQNQGYSHLTIVKTTVDKKPVLAREVMAVNEKPAPFQTDKQCTMSGCDEVAQPMAVPSSNEVVNTHINDVYFTIHVKMAKDPASLGKNAFVVTDILSESIERKK